MILRNPLEFSDDFSASFIHEQYFRSHHKGCCFRSEKAKIFNAKDTKWKIFLVKIYVCDNSWSFYVSSDKKVSNEIINIWFVNYLLVRRAWEEKKEAFPELFNIFETNEILNLWTWKGQR